MHFSVVRGAVGGFGSSTARLVLLWFCAVGSAPLGLSRCAQSRLALRVKSAPRALRFALSLRSLQARSRVARPRALGLSLCVARGRSGSRKRGTPPACLASLLSPRSVLLRGRVAPSPSQLRYSSALAPLRSIFSWGSSAGAVRSWWLGCRPDTGARAPGIWKSQLFFLLLRNNLKIYCLCMYLSRFSNSFSAGYGYCWRWSLCCYSSGFGSVKAR